MNLRDSFLRDSSGATMVEFGLLAPIVITLLVAVVQLSVYVWQWNSAQRAVRTGARLASMSAAVSGDIAAMNASGAQGGLVSAYDISCDGSSKTCTSGTYNADAMNRILTGGDGICATQSQAGLRGLCDMMPGITEANVTIRYTASVAEISGAPGGVQPIITLKLRNVGLEFSPLAAFGSTLISLPDTAATTLGQDLSDGGWS